VFLRRLVDDIMVGCGLYILQSTYSQAVDITAARVKRGLIRGRNDAGMLRR